MIPDKKEETVDTSNQSSQNETNNKTTRLLEPVPAVGTDRTFTLTKEEKKIK